MIEIVDVAAGDAALVVGGAGEVSSTAFALNPTAEVSAIVVDWRK